MSTFSFFADAGLTQELTGTLDFAQAADGSTGAVTKSIWLGSPTVGRTLRAAADPGVDPIVVSIADSAAGSGSPAGDVTLALEPGFAGRMPGASLSLGVQVSGGVANAARIYIRVLDSTHAIGLKTDLSLVATECEEL